MDQMTYDQVLASGIPSEIDRLLREKIELQNTIMEMKKTLIELQVDFRYNQVLVSEMKPSKIAHLEQEKLQPQNEILFKVTSALSKSKKKTM